MPDFPRHLPKPLVGTSSTASGRAVRQHTFSSNRMKQHRQLREDVREVSLTWIFTEEQYADFRTFVIDDLNNGRDTFVIRLARGGYLYDTEVRMVGEGFTSEVSGRLWTVSMNVEELNPLTLSVLYLELSEVFDMPTLLTGAEQLHHIVHVQYPAI